MSSEFAGARERVEYVQHGRPAFFDDPAVDKLLGMVMALLVEVCVLRERLDTLERVAEAGGISRAAVEAYLPDAAAAKDRAALREQAMARVLSVLNEEVARMRHEARG